MEWKAEWSIISAVSPSEGKWFHLESFLEEWSTYWDSSRHTAAPEPDCPTPDEGQRKLWLLSHHLHRFSLTLPCINGKTSKLLRFHFKYLNSTRSRNLTLLSLNCSSLVASFGISSPSSPWSRWRSPRPVSSSHRWIPVEASPWSSLKRKYYNSNLKDCKKAPFQTTQKGFTFLNFTKNHW